MRILIIDDEYAALTLLRILLSQYGSCDMATNGRQAFDMFQQALERHQPYDLITIDIEMPEIKGQELLGLICAEEEKRNVAASRKIMVTASGTKDNIVQAAMHRCHTFIVKPVRRQVLEKKLEVLGFRKDDGHQTPRDAAGMAPLA